jgi:hypothetical protein
VSNNDRVSGNEDAYLEIQNFLKALDSYPKCFAQKPGVSFEEHQRDFTPLKRSRSGSAREHNDDTQEN